MEELISDVVEKIEKERDRMDDSFSDGDGEMESEVEVQASEDPSDESEVDEVALSARSCQFCNKLFSTKGNKEDHEKYVHKKGPISKSAHFCKLADPGCGKVFSSKTSLRYHQLRAHGVAVCCEKCSKEFSNFKEFVKHRRSERGDKELPVVAKCSICKDHISSKNLKRHMREVHEIPTKNPLKELDEMWHCPKCSREFKRVEKLQRHLAETHSPSNQKKWNCGQCEKSFFFERNLKSHTERVHTHFPFYSTFNCNQCEKSFKVKGNLTRHQKEQHSAGEMFSCPSCGKKFGRKTNQMRHTQTCKKVSK